MDFWKIAFQMIVYPLLGILVVWLVKLADDRRSPFDENKAMLLESNLAVGLRKSGACLGLFLALAGVLSGRSPSILVDLRNFLEAAVMIVVFLFITFEINERVILRKVNNDEAVANGNVAVGAVEFSTFVGTGIIMNGAFSGEGGGLWAAGVFFILGQASLVIAFYLDAAISRRNIQEEIEGKGNLAEGVDMAGILIAISIILRAWHYRTVHRMDTRNRGIWNLPGAGSFGPVRLQGPGQKNIHSKDFLCGRNGRTA